MSMSISISIYISLSLCLYLSLSIHIYIYIYRERERDITTIKQQARHKREDPAWLAAPLRSDASARAAHRFVREFAKGGLVKGGLVSN